MKCPHCGGETAVEKPDCERCGQPLSVTAGAVYTQVEEDKLGEWGPRFLRYSIGLVVLACVLGIGASVLQRRPLTLSQVDQPRLSAPQPTFPTPSPPEAPPPAPLIEPVGVSLPSLPRMELAFGSRDPRVRRMFLERNGGDAQTEAAVQRGLTWLKSVQDDDGSWDCERYDGRAQNRLGVTGLALLAYLGAGHSHQSDGPYKDTVAKALKYVLATQDAQGRFPGALYMQGICTMAIVEAYGMTGDTTLLPHCQKAVDAIVAAQQPCGGWDYGHTSARNRGDTSVTGWQVMALKSARKVDIDVPDDTLKRAREFLTSITRADGAIGYTNPFDAEQKWRTTPALTAAGLNAHLFAGAEHDDGDVQKAVGFVLSKLPQEPQLRGDRWSPHADIYLWYHGSLSLSRLGGPEWRMWNQVVKRLLVKLQKKSGPDAGSWDTYGDPWRQHGGRIYFTSLAILALEVYYRYD